MLRDMPAPPTKPLSRAPRPSMAAMQPTAIRVTVLAGPDRDTSCEIKRPKVTIGRALRADVKLSDPTVSEFHIDLHGSGRSILVTDCGSVNGVRIGETQIERAWIRSGSKLQLGETIILLETTQRLSPAPSELTRYGGLVGNSSVMRSCFAELRNAAECDDDVLLEGESGTGKDLAARAIHENSQRKDKPLIIVNCGGLPYTDVSQVHSALFGHEKGAFTGSVKARKGAFREAEGGCVFLDEVGDLPLEIQTLLLHALEHRLVTPLGADRPIKVDVRVLFATWRNLPRMVNERLFRLDLYHRMGSLPIQLPALAEHREDIPLLIEHFVAKYNAELKSNYSIDTRTCQMLVDREYRGNVRELEKLVRRLVMRKASASAAKEILMNHKIRADMMEVVAAVDRSGQRWKDAMREFERAYVAQIQKKSHSRSQAARIAGVTRTQWNRILERINRGTGTKPTDSE